MLDLRIAHEAEGDIDRIRAYTLKKHGVEAMDRYDHLIFVAVQQLRENVDRIEVRPSLHNLSQFHLKWCRHDSVLEGQIVKNPRHILFFRVADETVLEIVRILKDEQDFGLHLGS